MYVYFATQKKHDNRNTITEKFFMTDLKYGLMHKNV